MADIGGLVFQGWRWQKLGGGWMAAGGENPPMNINQACRLNRLLVLMNLWCKCFRLINGLYGPIMAIWMPIVYCGASHTVIAKAIIISAYTALGSTHWLHNQLKSSGAVTVACFSVFFEFGRVADLWCKCFRLINGLYGSISVIGVEPKILLSEF